MEQTGPTQGGSTASAGDGPTFVPIPEIAEAMGLIVTKVHQLVRDRELISVRRGGIAVIPAEFIADGQPVRGLAGTITQLTDAGFDDEEILDWLFAANDETPPSAMAVLQSGRPKAVHRRAQIAGY